MFRCRQGQGLVALGLVALALLALESEVVRKKWSRPFESHRPASCAPSRCTSVCYWFHRCFRTDCE